MVRIMRACINSYTRVSILTTREDGLLESETMLVFDIF
jgi:hypothetical protein